MLMSQKRKIHGMDKIDNHLGLSFEDVLIYPHHANFIPDDISLETRLTKKIKMSIPFVSAPMESVTEHKMAIAIAQRGGIGIIHSYMTKEEQVKQIKIVKRAESYIIRMPDLYTVTPDDTFGNLKTIMKEKNISGVPVVLHDNKLIGLMTMRDVEYLDYISTDEKTKIGEIVSTVLYPNNQDDKKLITSRDGISRDEAEKMLYRNKIEKLPVINEGDYLVAMITKRDMRKRKYFPFATRDEEGRLLVGAAINLDGLERLSHLVDAGLDVLCIDNADGDTDAVGYLVEEIKSLYEDRLPVIAGNVCTAEGAEFLLEKGADALRVGLGPGFGCVTRLVSGAGMPQITAVLDCAKVANMNKYDVPIISDGGIRESGDVAKAIAAGASSVMIGSIFAATDESPAQEEMVEGTKIKRYRGMGSPEALSKRAGVGRYVGPKGGRVYEGVESPVQYRGSMEKVLNELVGGVKTGMFYSGKKTVDHLRLYGKLKVITPASQREGHEPFGV